MSMTSWVNYEVEAKKSLEAWIFFPATMIIIIFSFWFLERFLEKSFLQQKFCCLSGIQILWS